MRIVHLDLNWRHSRFEEYLDFVGRAAQWGYDAILVEYGDMFPFRSHPKIRHRDHWSPRQVAAFQSRAARAGIQVIPLVQTLGHLGIALRRENNRHLCEDPGEQDGIIESICPLKPQAVRLVRDLVNDVIEGHPGSQFIHLGGDEALMGVCPRCRARVRKVGKGRHYAAHMNLFIKMVLDAGQRPVIWADCLEHHLAGLEWIHPRTVLCDWFYENLALHQDWTHVRSADFHQAEMKRSRSYWAGRGTWSVTITRHTLAQVKPALRRELEPYFSHGVRDYPNRLHAFPFLRYFRRHGFEVMFGASMFAGGRDNRYAVNYDLHLKNCAAATAAVQEAGGLGTVITSWACCGFCPLETQFLGLAIAAQGVAEAERVAARYERRTFGKKVGLLNAYRRLFHCSFVPPIRFDGEAFDPAPIEEQMAAIETGPELFHSLEEAGRLSAWARGVGLRHREIELIHYAAEELRYKYRLAIAYHQWCNAHRAIDRGAIIRDLQKTERLFRRTFATRLTPWSLRQEERLRFGADRDWLQTKRPQKQHPQ